MTFIEWQQPDGEAGQLTIEDFSGLTIVSTKLPFLTVGLLTEKRRAAARL